MGFAHTQLQLPGFGCSSYATHLANTVPVSDAGFWIIEGRHFVQAVKLVNCVLAPALVLHSVQVVQVLDCTAVGLVQAGVNGDMRPLALNPAQHCRPGSIQTLFERLLGPKHGIA